MSIVSYSRDFASSLSPFGCTDHLYGFKQCFLVDLSSKLVVIVKDREKISFRRMSTRLSGSVSFHSLGNKKDIDIDSPSFEMNKSGTISKKRKKDGESKKNDTVVK